jgi:poly(3-hydroxyalkanoate) depolymerase
MSTDDKNIPTISMIKVGAQKLRTAIWEGTDDKLPLFLFNGIGANLEIIQPLADKMRDRTIITFDLPGVGGSPDPVLPYRPWWVAKAAKQALQSFGYEKADIMGISWGGGAAQQFAFQYKKMTNKLILAATSPGVTMVPGNMAALSKMASPQRYQDADFLAKNFETLYGDESQGASEFSAYMRPPSIRGYMFQLSAMMGWTALPFLPFLPHKTMVMSGDRDQIVPLANSRILKFAIPNAELYVFENAGHMFVLSKADEFLAVLNEFLDDEAPVANAA